MELSNDAKAILLQKDDVNDFESGKEELLALGLIVDEGDGVFSFTNAGEAAKKEVEEREIEEYWYRRNNDAIAEAIDDGRAR